MVQTHDLMIDGAGYMIVPGSYSYESRGADLHPVRAGVPSFEQRLAVSNLAPIVVDRDATRWATLGMIPIPVGLGDEGGRLVLGPRELTATLALGINFDANTRVIIYNGVVYYCVGVNLYKLTTVGGAWSSTAFIGAATGAVTGMCVSGGLLMIAEGTANLQTYAGSGALATPGTPYHARTVWDYARGIWRSKVDNVWNVVSGSIDAGATWTDFQVDSQVQAAVVWRGRATGGGVVLISTLYMLWELSGQWQTVGGVTSFSGTLSPVYDTRGGGGLDDFAYLVEYQGNVYTWHAGVCHRWDGSHLTPMAGGPRGIVTGMCVAGGYLCVSVKDVGGARWSVYAFDGARWGQLEISASNVYQNIAGTGGLISDGHLVSPDLGTQTFSRWEMPAGGFSGNPRASGAVIVGPLDAGQGDAVKTWTQITVAWSTALYPSSGAAPANPGGSLLVEYSVDDGSNYTSLGTTVIAAAARSGLAQVAIPSGGVEAHRLLVRVTWTPTSTYAAFQIDSVYASGWRVGDVPRLETWTAKIRCTDKLIKRDGTVDARSGETMLGALRALAQAGRTFSFNDIDQDLTARTVTARIVGIKETERKGDGVHFLESSVLVTIAAVA